MIEEIFTLLHALDKKKYAIKLFFMSRVFREEYM